MTMNAKLLNPISGKSSLLFFLSFILGSLQIYAFQPSAKAFNEYKGEVVNSNNGRGISSAYKATNPRLLVQDMLDKKDENYLSDQSIMTSFYRETIKKGWSNVSLSEAVVKIHKTSYKDSKKDLVSCIKPEKAQIMINWIP